MADINMDPTHTQSPEDDMSRKARLRRSRAALILVPIFFIIVMGLAMSGLGQEAARQAEANRPQPAQATNPELVKTVQESLPEDLSPAQRAKLSTAIEEALSDKPQDSDEEPKQQGSALGGFMMLFLIISIIAIAMGIWMLLANRAPRAVRITGRIALPLMVLTGLATTGLALVALNVEPEEKKRPFNTLAVMGDYARMDTVQLSVTTQGQTQPRTEIDLVPEVGGKIVYVSPNFIEGGIFKRGDTLVRIDPSDYEVAKISAEANLANARQALTREIAEGELARSDFEELGSGTPSALALRQPQRQQAEAAVRAAEAEVERARLQLDRTNVRAPFAGRVREKTSDVGQFVSPGSRLGRIFSTDSVQVRLPLTDSDLSKIDLPIAFVADSRETAPRVQLSSTIGGVPQTWEGRIMRTDATYDTQTRSLFAIAEVQDPYGTGRSENGIPLAPGLFVDAIVDGRVFENVIVLPRDGLRPRNEVYVVDDKGQAEIRTVEVIDTDASRAVLRTGVIQPRELVVVSPMERSRIETPLKVLDVNDPLTVIVEPPRPAWMGPGEEEDATSQDRDTTETDGSATESDSTSEASRNRDTDNSSANSDGG